MSGRILKDGVKLYASVEGQKLRGSKIALYTVLRVVFKSDYWYLFTNTFKNKFSKKKNFQHFRFKYNYNSIKEEKKMVLGSFEVWWKSPPNLFYVHEEIAIQVGIEEILKIRFLALRNNIQYFCLVKYCGISRNCHFKVKSWKNKAIKQIRNFSVCPLILCIM